MQSGITRILIGISGIKPRLFQPVALEVNAGAIGAARRAASGFGVARAGAADAVPCPSLVMTV